MFSSLSKGIKINLFAALLIDILSRQLTVETYAEAVAMLSMALMATETADIEQNEAILGAVADYFNELATFVTDTNVTINATVSWDSHTH